MFEKYRKTDDEDNSNENSLLGARYAVQEGRPVFEKIMRICWICIGILATVIIVYNMWRKFQTNPTITGLDTDFHNWDVPFPAITFCQNVPSNVSYIEKFANDIDILSDFDENFIDFVDSLTKLSYETLSDFKKYTNVSYIPDDTNLKEYVFRMMNPCSDIFKGCVWLGENYDCCHGFLPVFTENGFCYTFNSKHYERYKPGRVEELPKFRMKYVQETDTKWSLKMIIQEENAKQKFPVYIHNADEVPGLDVLPQHLWNFKIQKMFFSVKQTYTTSNTRQLNMRQRKCAFDDEMKLKIDDKYTYSACARQCRMETAKKYCGCIPHFYPEIEGFRHCKIKELDCIIDHLDEIKSVEECHCELSCSNTVYQVEKLVEPANLDEANWGLEVEFATWPIVRYRREILFGWIDLIVSLGAISGLFLGFSIFTGVRIFYYFTARACAWANYQPEKSAKSQREEIRKLKSKYDLSLMPGFTKNPNSGVRIITQDFLDCDNSKPNSSSSILKRNNKVCTSATSFTPLAME